MDERSLLIVLCLIGGGASVTLVMVAWYFDRRREHRFSKWRAIGLTPKGGTWDALMGRDNLAGRYRGRRFSLTTVSDETYENPPLFTKAQVEIRFPSGNRLSITPKWPSSGFVRLDKLMTPKTHRFEDLFSIYSDPPDLAVQVLTIPKIREILFSYPRASIELKGHDLNFERPGKYSDPQDAVALFDMLCDLADLIEQGPISAIAG
ncbi:MAG: hypothetical protein GTO14_01575 [Anaerolineales bacterium]|nr:hypothetical protein [Anaerolineales bacterium]